MKSSKHRIGNLLAALLLWPLFVTGFPPTPDHIIYGLVRDAVSYTHLTLPTTPYV